MGPELAAAGAPAATGPPPASSSLLPRGAIRGRLILSLLAGRGGYRVATVLSNVLLLAAWGEAGFAGYALVMGGFTAVLYLTAFGVEKSALTLLPRVRRVRGELTAVFVALSAGPGLLALIGIGGYGLATGKPPMWLLAGALAVGLGLNQVLVGLHRALGRPWRDVANHGVLVAAVAAATGGALLGLGPTGVLAVLLTAVAVLDLALLPGLAARPRGLRRPAMLRPAAGTAVLMSAGELAAAGTVSAVFLVLDHTGRAGQSGPLYLAVSASALLANAFGYLLRIVQPHVSLALHRSRAERPAARRAARGLRLLALAGPPWVVAATATAAWGYDRGPAVVLGGLYLACLPVFFGLGSVNFLLENGDRHTLRRTAIGSATGLAGAVLAALVLVPWLGAPGAIAAMATGDLVHAAVLLLILPRRSA
ncbi:hypothetical protein [Dactylosporangium sp. NPDC049140]|uniref:hypothetical protein n=1 Tax=Dactylosporangium sp. NPDC049140 TaxID=3155647 RepID=UPI0033C3941B